MTNLQPHEFEQLMVAANIHVYNSACMHAVRSAGRDLAELGICDALRHFADRGWNLDVPWTGASGDAELDARLAQAFRALLDRSTLDDRLRYIEDEVWRPQQFPHPAAPADVYRETLMRWWMELYDAGTAG